MEFSSGAVIRHHETFLILQYGLGHWGFVKGHIEPGETAIDAFYREAAEETGLTTTDLLLIDGFHEIIHYIYKKNGHNVYKEVQYYLADSQTTTVRLSSEHKTSRWLPYDEALKQITFPGDQEVFKKAHRFLQTRSRQ